MTAQLECVGNQRVGAVVNFWANCKNMAQFGVSKYQIWREPEKLVKLQIWRNGAFANMAQFWKSGQV
jgi:hypothetical protein